jgi:hypothetical protein
VGELAKGSETRGSQDWLRVDLAGAGRKNGRLSPEICRAARDLATGPAMGREGAAEVSRGHSTERVARRSLGKGRTRNHKAPRAGSVGE